MSMPHEKKLEFLHKIAKLGLDHIQKYDTGGGVVGGGGSGGVLSDVSGALTTQNTFSAQAPTSSATVGQQQAGLAGQLQNEAAGNGPNPAQLQYQQNAQNLAQQTATNNAQNRALAPGLAARMSSASAAQTGQQEAGTAAAQQAQQQLAAQGQLEGLTGQEQTGALGAAGINAQVSQNNANAVNNTEGGIVSGIGGAIGSLVGLAQGGEVKKMASGGSISIPGSASFSNASNLPSYSGSGGGSGSDDEDEENDNSKSAGVNATEYGGGGQMTTASDPANSTVGSWGSVTGMAPSQGSSFDSLIGPGGGAAPSTNAMPYAKGGEIGPQSHAGKWLKQPMKKMAGGGMASSLAQLAPLAMMLASKGGQAKGKNVPAMLSPGEDYLTPKKAQAVAAGKADPMKVGEKIKGHAKVRGDSEKNDIVPKMLKDGGMVIPRSITKMHPDKAAEFVRRHLSKKGMSVT